MLGVGMAMPGPVRGRIHELRRSDDARRAGRACRSPSGLTEATGLPAFVGGDLAAAALASGSMAPGANLRDFYYLYFGVGLGGCMVHEGQPLRGAFGNAGEIGHVPLVPNGEPCPCGNRGCLERYLSLEAFERRSTQIGARGAGSREAAPLLRIAIATIENLFDPETIILGGLAPKTCSSDLIARRRSRFAIPSASARDRTQPRLMLSAQRRRCGAARRRGLGGVRCAVAALRRDVCDDDDAGAIRS